MWRNYLTVGIRSLTKNRTYAFINILGLSLGIAACLLILTYVRYEFTYDAWIPGVERAYKLDDYYKPTKVGGEEMRLGVTSIASGVALKKDFPQFDRVVYMTNPPVTVLKNGQAAAVDRAMLADGNIFDILQVPFVRGNPAHALDDVHSLALSETEAKRQFGDINPIGKTMTIVSGDMKADYRVTAVFKDIPKNSTSRFDLVARFDVPSFFAKSPGSITSWNSQGGFVYARLKPGFKAADVEAQFPAWEKRNIPNVVTEGKTDNAGIDQDWHLRAVRDIHLAGYTGQRNGADRGSIITFAIVALLILGMACVNFTNLATARASQRAREVALRKVLGATRRQLITQFIGESMLIAAIATVIALALFELALPILNRFLDADMAVRYFSADGLILPVLILVIVVGLAGGAYPAFYLSRFQPAKVLKANKSAAEAEGSGRLRNLLVVAQFAVSIALIICTGVIYTQTVFARTADAGFQRDGLIQVDNMRAPQVEAAAEAMRKEIARLPGVTAVGRTSIGVAAGNNSMTEARRIGTTEMVALGVYGLDAGLKDALGMRLLAGRNFSETIAMDDATTPQPPQIEAEKAIVARGINIIISESAAKRLGFASSQAAIGQPLQVDISLPEAGLVPATVVGVVADVRYRTVRDPLQPILYYYQTNGFNRLLVRYAGVDRAALKSRIEGVWKRMVPEIPFEAAYADDLVHDLYNADERRAQLFGAFAVLAVVIGCLGLFGLAAFTAERRTKEIGIRKVLGARTRDILQLLIWQFSKPVLIANLIAWPAAWWFMRNWLNGFDTRIALGPMPFLLAGGLALLVAIVTIASHAWRVAQQNPVKALRYE
jgi:putative ABC transport system permease protein